VLNDDDATIPMVDVVFDDDGDDVPEGGFLNDSEEESFLQDESGEIDKTYSGGKDPPDETERSASFHKSPKMSKVGQRQYRCRKCDLRLEEIPDLTDHFLTKHKNDKVSMR
jgi:hypothetical protein